MGSEKNKKQQNRNYTNDQIRSHNVFLIDEEGTKQGRVSKLEALKISSSKGLDLVQVAFNEKDNLPICKIMDYGKLKYKKTKNKNKSKSHSHQLKEIKIGLNIAEHDLDIKIRQMKKFLDKGMSVKYSLQLRGRQRGNKDAALELFYNSLNKLEDHATWERPKVSENSILVILAPKKL